MGKYIRRNPRRVLLTTAVALVFCMGIVVLYDVMVPQVGGAIPKDRANPPSLLLRSVAQETAVHANPLTQQKLAQQDAAVADAVESEAKNQETLMTAADAHATLVCALDDGFVEVHEGKILAAAERIQAALLAAENVAGPDAALLDETHSSLQILSFFAAALMSDADLEAFCEPPGKPTPLGEMMRVAVHRLYRESYAANRPYVAMDEPAMREVCLRVRDSESVLGRFAALVLLSSPQWESLDLGALEEVVMSLNELAASFPDNPVTRDAIHQLIRACSGKAFEYPDAVKLLFSKVPWNAEVRAILESDPLVSDVQGLLVEYDANRNLGAPVARQMLVDSLQSLSKESPDARTRAWCVRAMASTNSLMDAETSPLLTSIRRGLNAVANAPLAPSADIPSEQLRAAYTLFANDVDSEALDSAEVQIPILRNALETAYAPDLNYFEAIPRKLFYYGMGRIREGNYEKANETLLRLQMLYPNSYLAMECEEHLNHVDLLLVPRP